VGPGFHEQKKDGGRGAGGGAPPQGGNLQKHGGRKKETRGDGLGVGCGELSLFSFGKKEEKQGDHEAEKGGASTEETPVVRNTQKILKTTKGRRFPCTKPPARDSAAKKGGTLV